MNQPATPEPPAGTSPLTDLDLWPLAGLRVVSGDLELRYIDDALLLDLARLAADGVHEPDRMPFAVPWTRGTPLEVARSVLAYQWRTRAGLGGSAIGVELAVVRDGEVLGIQGFHATDFAITRIAETGSWLGLRHQGQGVGTAMRRMMLHLLFEGLGAAVTTTGAYTDNGPSNGVSRRLGYEPNGTAVVTREGVATDELRYRMTRAAWLAQPDRPDVELHGVAPVRQLLGLDAPAPDDASPDGPGE